MQVQINVSLLSQTQVQERRFLADASLYHAYLPTGLGEGGAAGGAGAEYRGGQPGGRRALSVSDQRR